MRPAKIPKKLFHLSPTKLPVRITPRAPAGTTNEAVGKYQEPAVKRFCVSPTIEGCLQAIYPNISHHFEVRNAHHMDFYLYDYTTVNRHTIVHPSLLSKLMLVHDAHVTQEYWILDQCNIYPTEDANNEVIKVRLYNPKNVPTIHYYPYDDSSGKSIKLGPNMYTADYDVIPATMKHSDGVRDNGRKK